MSIQLTINGVAYNYPTTGSVNWGAVASNWAQAVTNGALFLSGGSFPLTSGVNFGSNYGLTALSYTSASASPATSGVINLANADAIAFRKADNSGDLLLTTDSSNDLSWNGHVISNSSGVIPVAAGGTGLASGTSGGILGYTASGVLASSAALTVSQLIIGGGAGATPATLAAGSQYQPLVMGASVPGYAALNLAQSAAVTGTLPIANGGTGLTSTSQNYGFFGPTSGAGAPSFRAMVAADVPTLNQNTSGTAANVTGTSNASLATLSGLTSASSLATVGTIGTGTWQGTTIAKGYGGTGVTSVTTSPTASSFAGWDASKNISANNFAEASTATASAATNTTLTKASTAIQILTGTTTQTYILPDCTTLAVGWDFEFNNNSTGLMTIVDNSSGPVCTAPAGGYAKVLCTNAGSAAGTWDFHYLLPNNASYGSAGTIIFPLGATLPAIRGTLTVGQLSGDSVFSMVGGSSATYPYWDMSISDDGNSLLKLDNPQTSTIAQTWHSSGTVAMGRAAAASYTNQPKLWVAGQANAPGLYVSNNATGPGNLFTGLASDASTQLFGVDNAGNTQGNTLSAAYATTATAAATTTLTVASAGNQYFTGSTTQIVLLPVATTLTNGFTYTIVNQSSGAVTVKSSGANVIQAMAQNTQLVLTCINTAGGTGTASWNWAYSSIQNTLASGGTVTSVTFTGDGTVLSSTPSSAVTTTGTVTASLATQTARTFLQGPTSGSAATPTFAALIAPTVQTLAYNSGGVTFTGNRTSGSPTLASVSSFTGLYVGLAISGTGIPNSTYIKAMSTGASTITMSANASSGSATSTTVTPSSVTASNVAPTYVAPTSPAPLYLKIRMVGGGGGGAGSASGGAAAAGNGGNTVFGSGLTANGGGGGNYSSNPGQGGPGGTITAITLTNATGATWVGSGGDSGGTAAIGTSAAGGTGGTSPFGGAGAGASANNGAGNAAAANSGSGGGGGATENNSGIAGGGGGSGAYVEAIVSSPSSTYTFTVPAGGTAGSGAIEGGAAGGSGYIIVEEYYQ